MESSVTQRIKHFCKETNITVSAFEKQCNMGNGYVGKIVDGIGADKLSSISRNFPNLNFKWLLIGEGPMLVDDCPNDLDFGKFETILNSITKAKDETIASKSETIDVLRKENERLEAEIESLHQSLGIDTRKKELA